VVECSGFENQRGFTVTGGSNPSLSETKLFSELFFFFFEILLEVPLMISRDMPRSFQIFVFFCLAGPWHHVDIRFSAFLFVRLPSTPCGHVKEKAQSASRWADVNISAKSRKLFGAKQ
jgi:hypothetical protein